MADKCKTCPIRTGCDLLSFACRLTARELVRLRPDLIGTGEMRNRIKWAEINAPILAAKREEQKATARLGFAKYDRRRKNAKGYWRTEQRAKTSVTRKQA